MIRKRVEQLPLVDDLLSTRKSPNRTGSSVRPAIVFPPASLRTQPTSTHLHLRCQDSLTSFDDPRRRWRARSINEYAALPHGPQAPSSTSAPSRSDADARRQPRVRRGTVRVAADVATRMRSGHPYLFRDALGARPLQQSAGDVVEIVDPAGEFVAKGIYDPIGAIAVRVVSRNPDGVFDAETILRRVEAAKRAARAALARRRQHAPIASCTPRATRCRASPSIATATTSSCTSTRRRSSRRATRSTTRSRRRGSRAPIYEQRRYPSAGGRRRRASRRRWRAASSRPSSSRSRRTASSSSST